MKPELPWTVGSKPLMLAPMQGLTNREMRSLIIEWSRPDVVFTEFIRVCKGARKVIKGADLDEISGQERGVPLVVQLIGHDRDSLVSAAEVAQRAGAKHLNLNMGCPYGRMRSNFSGGGMLRVPERLPEILAALREVIEGSFSVKLRSGFDDPRQIFGLLPMFVDNDVDFIALHSRTVVQRYTGEADHALTAEVVRCCELPVIANGDVVTAAQGRRVLERTGAAGLMIGRGAIGDPLLFARIRGDAEWEPRIGERAQELQRFMGELLERYSGLFCGEVQMLSKLKEVLSHVREPALAKTIKKLRRCRTADAFLAVAEELSDF